MESLPRGLNTESCLETWPHCFRLFLFLFLARLVRLKVSV